MDDNIWEYPFGELDDDYEEDYSCRWMKAGIRRNTRGCPKMDGSSTKTLPSFSGSRCI